MEKRQSRRELLTGLLSALRGPSRTRRPDLRSALRPPGALQPDDDFLAACTGCGECAPVCPVQAIVMVPSG